MSTLVSPVVPAVEGDATTIGGELRHVGDRCDCARVGYWCLSCHQLLANIYQAELHVEHGGAHVIARDCNVHGLGAL